MTYDDIVAAFIEPPATPIAAPALPATTARRLRDALEPIATQGWWSRPAAERVQALGLGFFDGYVWGRAASLGTPSPATVVATFGVFAPELLAAVYAHGSSQCSREDVLAAREVGATESLSRVVSPDDADAIATPLLDALAGLDATGRPLFAALRALPTPESAAGRLWRAAELVREHRGDGHLAACVASGLDVATVNVLTELWLGFAPGEYSSTRGCSADVVAATVERLTDRGWVADGALTAAGRAVRDELEAATDRSQQALVDALGDRLDEIVDRAEAVSAALLAARSFPHDPRKRAAG
jgi:hypothetical protein